jgi:hypothetical protein
MLQRVAATAVGATVFAALATACTPSESAEPDTFTISGFMHVGSDGFGRVGEFCYPDAGFTDIGTGTDVTVTNSRGRVVAISALRGEGTYVDPLDLGPRMAMTCEFTFRVRGVPEGEQFYAVEVGSRGVVRYTRNQLNQDIAMELTSY